jgi:hypothetical protein
VLGVVARGDAKGQVADGVVEELRNAACRIGDGARLAVTPRGLDRRLRAAGVEARDRCGQAAKRGGGRCGECAAANCSQI